MQMCNPVTNGLSNGMPGTALANQIVNTNNSSPATTANGSLVVDSIKSSTNFTLNEDSNGVKDATKKSARVIYRSSLSLSLGN